MRHRRSRRPPNRALERLCGERCVSWPHSLSKTGRRFAAAPARCLMRRKAAEKPLIAYTGAMGDASDARSVTRLLLDWRGGHQEALDELLPLVYAELRRVAQARL